MVRVGIIGAMEEEVNALLGKMVEPVVEKVAGCTFTLGKIEEVEVVLTLCGIGKANAAMATALLNDRYSPDYVVNTGVAGGLHEGMAVGDIVISTEVRYHDVDATVFGYEYGQIPGSVPAYMPSAKLIDIAKQAAKEVGIRTETGLVLTGDSFMGEQARVQKVKEQFPASYCVEMEAGAISQVCHQFETPFVIIRALSDVAGHEALVSYETFLKKAADCSAKQVQHMLRALAG